MRNPFEVERLLYDDRGARRITGRGVAGRSGRRGGKRTIRASVYPTECVRIGARSDARKGRHFVRKHASSLAYGMPLSNARVGDGECG
jgi:hypothetical protein